MSYRRFDGHLVELSSCRAQTLNRLRQPRQKAKPPACMEQAGDLC